MYKKKKQAIPKHYVGAIIGAGMSIFNSIMAANKEKALATEQERMGLKQAMASQTGADRIALEDYPVEGNEDVRGFYKKGGKINLVGYNAVGGDLLSLSNNTQRASGNTHGESTIDGTSGIKLVNPNGKAVAEIEDDEVIKDNKLVFSDRLKTTTGKTYADEAELLGNRMGKFEKVLANPNANKYSKNTANLSIDNINSKMDKLFANQESMKKAQGIEDTDGANIPKGGYGMNTEDPPMEEYIDNPGAYANKTTTATADPGGGNGFDFTSLIPYADNVVNAFLTNKTPKVAAPIMAKQRPFDTTVNVTPQLNEVTDTVAQTTSGIQRGTASSNVATQRMMSTRLAGMKATNSILANKENAETALGNQDIQNQQRIEATNLARINRYTDNVRSREMNVQGRIAGNVANAVEDFNKKEAADAAEKYQDKQLAAIRGTHNIAGVTDREMMDNPDDIARLKGDLVEQEAVRKRMLAKDADGNYVSKAGAEKFIEIFGIK